MREIRPGLEAAESTYVDLRTDAEKNAARERAEAWMKGWKLLTPSQQAAWHALPRAEKDASYFWSAEELTAKMVAVAPQKPRRINAA